MKQLFIIGLIFIIACNKDDIECQLFLQPETWVIEDFKTDYSIHFPPSYEGEGMVGFEGNIFFKNSVDNSIILQYSFCGPLYCEDFGNDLATPLPEMIFIETPFTTPVNLTEKQSFCNNGVEYAVLYYNISDEAIGKLYMNHDGKWLEAMYIEFNRNKLDELIEIVGSISSN